MQIIAYLMVCSWWVVRRWVCVYGYVFSSLFCSVFHPTAIYVPPFSAQNECSTFSFPAFPEMDSWDPNPPKRQRCIPNSRLQKSCAKGMYVRYVQYKNQKFVDRRESVVANVSIGELLCEQRPAEKDSKGWEITTQKVNIHSYRAQRGPKETYNMAASPTCLICLPQSALAVFCASGNRSNGCGSIVRTSARAREKMERARRWVTMRMIGEMGAMFCGESSFFLDRRVEWRFMLEEELSGSSEERRIANVWTVELS